VPLKVSFIVSTFGDPSRPWIITATSRDAVEIESAEAFWSWALARWPKPRHGIKVIGGL